MTTQPQFEHTVSFHRETFLFFLDTGLLHFFFADKNEAIFYISHHFIKLLDCSSAARTEAPVLR